MPKAFSLVFFLAIAGASATDAQEQLLSKIKALPVCAALASAANTNHIPLAGASGTLTNHLIRPGDSITLLGNLFLKKEQVQWLLYVEARTPVTRGSNPPPPLVLHMFGRNISFPSKPVPAKMQMLGPFTASATGKQLKPRKRTAEFTLNESFLGVGLERAAETIWRRNQNTNETQNSKSKLTPDEQQAIAGAIPALNSYFEIVQNTDGLEDLLTKLVKMPSLWSIVRHLGVTPGIHFGKESYPANPADWNLPAGTPIYYLPCLLRLNGEPALKITMVVTTPNPPLLVCGGVVGLLAEKIDDNDTYMTLRVISAKSGSHD